jgi:hypothetical protein
LSRLVQSTPDSPQKETLQSESNERMRTEQQSTANLNLQIENYLTWLGKNNKRKNRVKNDPPQHPATTEDTDNIQRSKST